MTLAMNNFLHLPREMSLVRMMVIVITDSVIRSSDEELHQRIDRKLWRIMSLSSYCNQRCILPSFKFYVKLCQMLKRDEVYKTLMKDVQKVGNGMDFNQALRVN